MEDLFKNLDLRLGMYYPKGLPTLSKIDEIFKDKFKDYKELFIQKLG